MFFLPLKNCHQILQDLKEEIVPEDHIGRADAWAVARCAELRAQGIEASLWRPGPGEALCVVYKISQAREVAA